MRVCRGGEEVGEEADGAGRTRLYVPEPEAFYPQFDGACCHALHRAACRTLTVSAVACVDGNTRIRETCEVGKCFECKAKGRRDGPLSDRQRRACDKLRGHGYSNDPVWAPLTRAFLPRPGSALSSWV